jgi:hypothetical protein
VREPNEQASTRDPVPGVLVVGASTGGPRALAAALGELPREFRSRSRSCSTCRPRWRSSSPPGSRPTAGCR